MHIKTMQTKTTADGRGSLFADHLKYPMLVIALVALVLFSLSSGCSRKQEGVNGEARQEGQIGASTDASAPLLTEKSKILAEGVKSAKLVLETKDGNDVLNVVILDKAKDSDSIRYQCEWTRNGEPAGTGAGVTGFKRGDKLSVKITPVDGETLGRAKTLTTEIKNSTPKIIELKNIAADEKHLSYQVVAKDADGDTLTYSLADGVKGMTIDGRSGVVQWSIDPAAPQADITVTVKVADGLGGEVTYPLRVQQQDKQEKQEKQDKQEKPAK